MILTLGGYFNLTAQCDIDGPVNVVEGNTDMEFYVTDLTNTELGVNQALVRVVLGFRHKVVGKLGISLTSPSGDQVTLVGQASNANSTDTNGAIWEVSFLALANQNAVNTDEDFADIWDNTNAWEINTRYNGSYLPNNGNLEDFTGTALGVWTLNIEDLSLFGDGKLDYAQLQFQDQNGFECAGCYVNAGRYKDLSSNVFCDQDPLISDPSTYAIEGKTHALNSADENYVILQGGALVTIQDNLDLTTLGPGNYTLCALLNEKSQTADLLQLTDLATLEGALASELYCGDLMSGTECIDIVLQAPAIQNQEIVLIICPDEPIICEGPECLNFAEATSTTVFTYIGGVCQTSTPYLVLESNLRANIQASGTTVDCGGSVLLDGSGSVGQTSFTWSSNSGVVGNASGAVLNVSEPGSYTLTVRDADCEDSFTIDIGPGTSYNYTVDFDADPIGCNNPTANVKVNVDGDYTSVEWEHNGSTDEEITVNAAGVYTVTVFDNNNPNCPQSKHEVQVLGATQALEPFFNNYGNISCATGVDISVINEIFAADAEWLDSDGENVGNGTSINLSIAGTYTFSYEDIYGCSREKELIVDTNGSDISVAPTAEFLQCNVFSAQLFANVAGGQAADVRWRGPSQFNSSAENPTVELPGIYRVVVTDAAGCTAEGEVRVSYDASTAPLNNLSAGFPALTCDQPSVTINVNGPNTANYEYEWEKKGVGTLPGETSASLVTEEPGDFFVYVTNPANGCTIKLYSFVNLNNKPPDIVFTDDLIDCDSPSIVLSSDAVPDLFRDGEFSWTGPNGFSSNELFPTIDMAGEYILSATSVENGCMFELNTEVFEDFEPIEVTSASGEDSYEFDCNNQNPVFAFEASRSGNFVITTPNGNVLDTVFGTRTLPLIADSIGIWNIHLVGTNGCFDDFTLEVIEGLPRPDIEIVGTSTSIDCTIESSTLTVNTLNSNQTLTYVWSDDPSITDREREIFDAGIYSVEVTNDINCMAIESFEITYEGRDVEAIVVPAEINCLTPEATIKVESIEGGLTYEWEDENGTALGMPDVDSILVATPGMYTVTVTAPDNCNIIETIEVLENIELVDFALSPVDQITCDDPNPTATLDQDVTDVSQIGQVYWTVFGDTVATGVDTILEKGGMYEVIVVGLNGCESTRTIDVDDIRDLPTIDLVGNQELNCLEESLVITANVTPVLGEDDSNWDLSNNDDGIDVDGDRATITEPGEYIFFYLDDNGCSLKDTVIVLDAPEVALISNDLDCHNEEASIAVDFLSNIDSLNWFYEGASLDVGEDSLSYTTTDEGIYEIYYRGTNGCENTITDTVFFYEPISDANLVGFDPCPGDETGSIDVEDIVGGAGNIEYDLNDDGFSETNRFEELEAGEYIITLRDSLNCTYTDTIDLNDGRPIDIQLIPDTIIDLGTSISIDPVLTLDGEVFDDSELDSIFWTSTDGHFSRGLAYDSIMPFINTTYTLNLIDTLGCEYREEVVVDVSLDNLPIYFGNIFRPTIGDANNFFGIRTTDIVERVNKFMILDRWGNLLFEKNDFDADDPTGLWDGKVRDKLLEPGVYLYMVEVDLLGDSTTGSDIFVFTGDVTLVH